MSHTARPALTRSVAKAIAHDRDELLPLALFCGSGLLISVMLLIAEKLMFAAG
ncbi:hypothetical protein HNR60_001271 [Rhodopseudomonas rhenobacensis]|uniref:Uncharacterized protein n=1 Tax=Rhodopseudomonas rhenobacensis TaxID=87461 RepID=A0A7W7Z1Z1_9BRAD|nr:hypothetical protein [Rhodopseudomonas rhenobacensis]MBB5046526.1 hypothetical protein [Rhodopseudomonas rhenobacensis]